MKILISKVYQWVFSLPLLKFRLVSAALVPVWYGTWPQVIVTSSNFKRQHPNQGGRRSSNPGLQNPVFYLDPCFSLAVHMCVLLHKVPRRLHFSPIHRRLQWLLKSGTTATTILHPGFFLICLNSLSYRWTLIFRDSSSPTHCC